MRTFIPHPGQKIALRQIRAAVEGRFRVRLNDLSQYKEAVYARHIAWYLARTLTSSSLTAISRELGQRHHTSVLMAITKMSVRVKYDEGLLIDLVALRKALGCADAVPRESREVFDAALCVPDFSGEWAI